MAVPDLDAVKTYLGQKAASYSDEQITEALAAETAAQKADRVEVGDYPANIAEALMRRVHRNLAMRGMPLGLQANETGAIRIGRYDPEIRRLEAPYRKLVVG